jgi:uncharacterized membrane protein YbhN (UPF0104 family)
MSSPSRPSLSGLGLRGTQRREHGVRIVDTPAVRVHHPADLVGVVLSALGIAAVLVLAVYAQGTTTGVTEDVQGFASVVRRILFLPVAVLEGLITFVAPLAVLVELVLRRLVRHAFEALGAAVLAVLVALLTAWLITEFGIDDLREPFGVWNRARAETVVTIPALLAGTAALLTVAGSRNRRRTLGVSWNLLWIALGVALITGLITLPGALMTVLLGRLTGQAVRYLSGVQSERAYGAALVDGIRRAGFDPVRLIRVRDVAAAHPAGDDALASDLAAVAITRYGDNRVYAMTTVDDERLDVVVLDGDRQVVGMLARFWRSLRLRGIDGRGVVSLRQAAERAALLSYAAWSAGVRTPRLLALAEAEDSMLLVQQHAQGAIPLRDVPTDALTDDVLDAAWEQLRVAHLAGLAHRALTSDVILVDTSPAGPADDDAPVAHPVTSGRTGDRPGGPTVLLTGWDSGDVASSELARRMDIAQMLAALALRVGAERAVASAGRVLVDAELATIGPLLQTIALPRATRDEARQHRGVLAEVREALLARLPEADVEPERLVRFGARTVITIALSIAAAVVVVTTISFNEIATAVTDAEQPWWALVTFGLGMLTFLGSAMALVAFSPVKLPLWRATLVQCAASFVALVAPAGVGPAALNLRMLSRRGVSNALAVASVGLVQVSQLITTLLLLLVLSLVSGTGDALQMPSTTVIVTLGFVVLGVTAAMLVPVVRQWVLARTVPVWRQTWPRLIQLLSEPRRFAIAVAGNLIMTLGYLGAFYAALASFGQNLSAIDLALIYLIGNAAGAIAPLPGGLGSVEIALIGGLTATGNVPAAIATSVVFLFRALTFWARVPFGWLAMRLLQRTGEH